MATVKNSGKLPVRDGTGTKTPTLHTGHGSGVPAQPTTASQMRKFDQDRLMPGKTLKKLQAPAGGAYGYNGQNRFVQPTLADTAQMPPRIGGPRL